MKQLLTITIITTLLLSACGFQYNYYENRAVQELGKVNTMNKIYSTCTLGCENEVSRQQVYSCAIKCQQCNTIKCAEEYVTNLSKPKNLFEELGCTSAITPKSCENKIYVPPSTLPYCCAD